MSNRENRRLAFWASVALVVTMPMVVWWAVGDVSEPGADYIIRPIRVSPPVQALLIAASSTTFFCSGLVLWWHRQSYPLKAGRRRLLVKSLALGALAGGGARVITASTHGANIGGGFLLFVGLPVLLYNAAHTYEKAVQIRVDDVAPGWTPSTVDWLWARWRWRQ